MRSPQGTRERRRQNSRWEFQKRTEGTYEFLLLTAVCYADVGLAALVEDSEGEVLNVGLNLSIGELATDETLSVEDGVMRVHRDLVLGGIADQTLGVGEGDERGGCPVTLIVGDNLDAVVPEDADTRVCGAEIDTDGSDHFGCVR